MIINQFNFIELQNQIINNMSFRFYPSSGENSVLFDEKYLIEKER
jgi:hypothetical protein